MQKGQGGEHREGEGKQRAEGKAGKVGCGQARGSAHWRHQSGTSASHEEHGHDACERSQP